MKQFRQVSRPAASALLAILLAALFGFGDAPEERHFRNRRANRHHNRELEWVHPDLLGDSGGAGSALSRAGDRGGFVEVRKPCSPPGFTIAAIGALMPSPVWNAIASALLPPPATPRFGVQSLLPARSPPFFS